MKQFFGAFFGSILGLLITGVVTTLIIVFAVIGSLKDSMKLEDDKTYVSKENSVLRLTLNGEVKERGAKNPFGDLDLGPFIPKGNVGLDDIISNLKKAKNDKHIKGVYLEISTPLVGFATLEEIRNALIDFKASGKFIYAYSEIYTQKAYYVASTATKVFLNPQGAMELKGLSSQMMFFKNMLEKLNVEVEIFRHGKFKSAIEPFMLDKMSEANRAQVEVYLGSLWGHLVSGISSSRSISTSDLNNMANNISIQSPEDAVKYKLIDELKYEDEVLDLIKKTINLKEKEKIHFVSMESYINAPNHKKPSKNKVAVIYAVGEIISGEGDEDYMGSENIVKAIREARTDSSIKAIVLRVNSPGGSALASDVIWREAVLAKKSKPFIVSMGDVAASGGYYISCAADYIFAQPNTITGSIGVFGMLPNVQKLFSEKFGITVDTVNTNKHSDLGSLLRKTSAPEHDYIQKSVERIYEVFTLNVAAGRGMKQADVDSIGQGRVWSGADAIKIKLVDELGGIKDAIAYAVKKAKLTDYKIENLPRQKDPLQELLGNTKDEMETRAIKSNLGAQYIYIKQVKNFMQMKGVQARLPFEMVVE